MSRTDGGEQGGGGVDLDEQGVYNKEQRHNKRQKHDAEIPVSFADDNGVVYMVVTADGVIRLHPRHGDKPRSHIDSSAEQQATTKNLVKASIVAILVAMIGFRVLLEFHPSEAMEFPGVAGVFYELFFKNFPLLLDTVAYIILRYDSPVLWVCVAVLIGGCVLVTKGAPPDLGFNSRKNHFFLKRNLVKLGFPIYTAAYFISIFFAPIVLGVSGNRCEIRWEADMLVKIFIYIGVVMDFTMTTAVKGYLEEVGRCSGGESRGFYMKRLPLLQYVPGGTPGYVWVKPADAIILLTGGMLERWFSYQFTSFGYRAVACNPRWSELPSLPYFILPYLLVFVFHFCPMCTAAYVANHSREAWGGEQGEGGTDREEGAGREEIGPRMHGAREAALILRLPAEDDTSAKRAELQENFVCHLCTAMQLDGLDDGLIRDEVAKGQRLAKLRRGEGLVRLAVDRVQVLANVRCRPSAPSGIGGIATASAISGGSGDAPSAVLVIDLLILPAPDEDELDGVDEECRFDQAPPMSPEQVIGALQRQLANPNSPLRKNDVGLVTSKVDKELSEKQVRGLVV
jgi:hypothetical protein